MKEHTGTDFLEKSVELFNWASADLAWQGKGGETCFTLCAVRTESNVGEDSINLAGRSVTERIELHFLPIDVETDDLSQPPDPSAQLERGGVSVYFGSHPALCSELRLFVFRLLLMLLIFFSNLPHLATSEKQTGKREQPRENQNRVMVEIEVTSLGLWFLSLTRRL